jgi:hypothetical protein
MYPFSLYSPQRGGQKATPRPRARLTAQLPQKEAFAYEFLFQDSKRLETVV